MFNYNSIENILNNDNAYKDSQQKHIMISVEELKQLFEKQTLNLVETLLSNMEENNNSTNTTVKLLDKNKEENLPTLIEGSISKRKDGRWMGRYINSDKNRKSIYAKTKKEIIIKLNKAVKERDKKIRQGIATSRTRLNDWIEIWLEKHKKDDLKTSSIIDYESNLVTKVKKHNIGQKEISNITPQDLDNFFKSIEAPAAKARTYRQLKTCMTAAYKYKIIVDNPFDIAKSISEPNSKKPFPPRKDFDKLFEYLKENNPAMYLFAKFIASTGLRKGEALALTWDDIIYPTSENEYGKIKINKAYELKADKIQTPKTKSSIRVIPLFPDARYILDLIPVDNKLIFANISEKAVTKRLRIYNKKLGTEITLHTLRHYFATNCYYSGVKKKTIQNWLGHTKSDFTINTYVSINDQYEKEEIKKIANLSDIKDDF